MNEIQLSMITVLNGYSLTYSINRQLLKKQNIHTKHFVTNILIRVKTKISIEK